MAKQAPQEKCRDELIDELLKVSSVKAFDAAYLLRGIGVS